MIKILYSLAAALLLAACATPGPQVRTDVNPSVDFSQYRTYAYVDPLGTDRAGYRTLLTQRLKRAVDRSMQERGFTYAPENPDLLVNFYVNVEEKQRVTSAPTTAIGIGYGYYGYRYGLYSAWPAYETRTYEYTEGTLTIDLVDAEKLELAWNGVIEGRLTEEALANPEQTVNAAVAAIFERFPFRVAT